MDQTDARTGGNYPRRLHRRSRDARCGGDLHPGGPHQDHGNRIRQIRRIPVPLHVGRPCRGDQIFSGRDQRGGRGLRHNNRSQDDRPALVRAYPEALQQAAGAGADDHLQGALPRDSRSGGHDRQGPRLLREKGGRRRGGVRRSHRHQDRQGRRLLPALGEENGVRIRFHPLRIQHRERSGLSGLPGHEPAAAQRRQRAARFRAYGDPRRKHEPCDDGIHRPSSGEQDPEHGRQICRHRPVQEQVHARHHGRNGAVCERVCALSGRHHVGCVLVQNHESGS